MSRKVTSSKQSAIMDDLLKLKVTRSSDWHSEFVKISRWSKVSLLKAKALKKLGLRNSEAQIWAYYDGSPHRSLNLYDTLESERILANQEILLQAKVNGYFPMKLSTRPPILTPQGPVEQGSSSSASLSTEYGSLSSDEELEWMQEEVQTQASALVMSTPAKYTDLHIALTFGERIDMLRAELKEERAARRRVEQELAADRDTVRSLRAAYDQMGRAFRGSNS